MAYRHLFNHRQLKSIILYDVGPWRDIIAVLWQTLIDTDGRIIRGYLAKLGQGVNSVSTFLN